MGFVRKLTMLLVSALALAAFALPAAAHAEGPFWHVNGEPLTEEVEVPAEGNLVFRLGPSFAMTCNGRDFDATLRNGEEKAEGEITALTTTGCTTNYPGCSLTSLTAKTLPWSLAVGAQVDLESTKFDAALSPGCEAYGWPPSMSWSGTLKGASFEEGCIQYVEAGWLQLTNGWAITTTGSICFEMPEEGVLTLE